MEQLSVFDIFKIGVGPSSSHTLGPWRAAQNFVESLSSVQVERIEVFLYGSLSKTGRGHCTDIAAVLGICGYDPVTIDTESIDQLINIIKEKECVYLNQLYQVPFQWEEHIHFQDLIDPRHPNTIKFKAYHNGELIEQVYFSVGGGFIVKEGTETEENEMVTLPYPIHYSSDLIKHVNTIGGSIADIVWQNETAFRPEGEIIEQLDKVYHVMLAAVYKGCQKEGVLPGGLKVKRRAKLLNDELLNGQRYNSIEEWQCYIKESDRSFEVVNKWVSCFALAVNEENASLGRVVTSPTNGASGVIPAVLLYHQLLHPNKGKKDIYEFLLTAGEIGCMFKKEATISAAVAR